MCHVLYRDDGAPLGCVLRPTAAKPPTPTRPRAHWGAWARARPTTRPGARSDRGECVVVSVEPVIIAAATRCLTLDLAAEEVQAGVAGLPPEPPPVATLRPLPSPLTGSPPITRTTLPTCRAHYPGGSSGCACRLLPRSCSLPQMAGGSASALSLSRPAQASLTLGPARSLSRLWQPLSRGSGPAGYPAEPLVSYRINRQLSG